MQEKHLPTTGRLQGPGKGLRSWGFFLDRRCTTRASRAKSVTATPRTTVRGVTDKNSIALSKGAEKVRQAAKRKTFVRTKHPHFSRFLLEVEKKVQMSKFFMVLKILFLAVGLYDCHQRASKNRNSKFGTVHLYPVQITFYENRTHSLCTQAHKRIVAPYDFSKKILVGAFLHIQTALSIQYT